MQHLSRRTLIGGLAAAAGVGMLEATPAAASSALDQPMRQTTVFTRNEGAYSTFRCPALLQAADGTLLAFAEGRIDSPADNGNIAMVLKRSTDHGATWGPIQVVAQDSPDKFGNPVPILDRNTGRIVLNTTRTDGGATSGDIACGRTTAEESPRPFIQFSDDNGATWSDPSEITDQVSGADWRGTVCGPGKGIQLTQGKHAGRMIIPGRHNIAPPSDRECSTGTDARNQLFYSDDGGTTWHLGAVDQPGNAEHIPNEVAVVELADGTLYISTRDQGQSLAHRLDTTSSDGGETFDRPFTPVNGVTTSQVQGSLLRLPATKSVPDRVMLSAPAHPTSRERLTLWSSWDGGDTWEPSCEVNDGPSAYSDTVLLVRGRVRQVGVLFEGGDRLYTDDGTSVPSSHDVRFIRVSERRLDRPAAPPRVTPDTARDQAALISGRPKIVPAPFGKGMSLAGDYVVLPLSEEITFGDGPFTAALWFRSDYTANSLALFYGYGQYSYQPKWWVRVEPANKKIRAHLETDVETKNVDAPGEYADGQWHHVALTRDGNGLTLYVDGAKKGTADPINGTISSQPPVGIRIGARLDGINYPLIGDIDEVWLFKAALTAEQVALLAKTNAVEGVQPAAHLPLDRITR